MATEPPDADRRAGITVAVMLAIVAVGIGLAAVFSGDTEPPPDEDAYVAAIFTTPEFDWMVPKKPFIEQGYEACELLREGYTEKQAALVMSRRNPDSGTEPQKVQDRHLKQTVAAHKHLCPGA